MRFSRRAALTLIVLATSSVAAQAQGYYNPNAYLMSQGAYLGPGYAGAPLNPTLAPLVAAQQAQLAQQQQALAAQQQMQLGQPTQGASSQQSPGVSGTGGTANTVIVTDPRMAICAIVPLAGARSNFTLGASAPMLSIEVISRDSRYWLPSAEIAIGTSCRFSSRF